MQGLVAWVEAAGFRFAFLRNERARFAYATGPRRCYDDTAPLAGAHAAMKAFKLEDGLKGIAGVVELHPGAARFFKEKGISQ